MTKKLTTLKADSNVDCELDDLELWTKAIGMSRSYNILPGFSRISKEFKLVKSLPSSYSLQKLKTILSIKPIQLLFATFLSEESVEKIIDSSKNMSKNKDAYKEGAKLMKTIIKNCEIASQ